MHQSAVVLLEHFVEHHLTARRGQATRILYIGDGEVRGYRAMFADPHWNLTMLYEVRNAEVTAVVEQSSWRRLGANSFDVVVSNQVFERFDFPWISALEVSRVLRPGGLACIVAISASRAWRPPIDCWRFYPDGLAALVEWADLGTLELFIPSVAGDPETPSGDSLRMVVAQRPSLGFPHALLTRLKLRLLHALSARQARRRAEHLSIRRGTLKN